MIGLFMTLSTINTQHNYTDHYRIIDLLGTLNILGTQPQSSMIGILVHTILSIKRLNIQNIKTLSLIIMNNNHKRRSAE